MHHVARRSLGAVALGILAALLAGCGQAATATATPELAALSSTAATQATPAHTAPPSATQPPPTATPLPPAATRVLPTRTPLLPSSTPPPPAGAGLIAFVSVRDGNGEIYVMESDGSNPRRLTSNRLWDGFPDWSPDGTRIAYYSYLDDTHWVIKVMNADGSDQRQLTDGSACDGAPHWSPEGALITYDSGDCSGTGREIYAVRVDGGTPLNLTNSPADEMLGAWSPDGQQIAFTSDRDGNYEIYVMAADGGDVRRLVDNPSGDHAPAWSPDGNQIAFYSERDGNAEVYVMDADGSDPRNLTNHPADDWFPRWSPDGRQITFSSWRDSNLEIYAMNADGSGVRRLTRSPREDFNSVWQPPAPGRQGFWTVSYEGRALGTVLGGTPSGDRGYLFVGSTHYTHNNRDDEDLYLLRTGAAGEILTEKSLGGSRFDRGLRIVPAPEGGFYVAGETRSVGAGDRDLYLLQVTPDGESLWSRAYGGPQEEKLSDILPVAGGGLLLVGQTESFGAGGSDVYLVMADGQGNEIWSQTYGTALDEEGYAAAEVPGGGFLLLGSLLHEGGDYLATNPDVYLVRIDEGGAELWSKALEEPGVQAGFRLLPTSDGNYLVTGLRSDKGTEQGTDPLCLKIDREGNVLWNAAVGEAEVMDYGAVVLATEDGGFLLTGLSVRGGRGSIPLTRLDANGRVLWRRTLSEGQGNRAGIALMEAVDGGIVVIGSVSDGRQGWYTVLIKTDAVAAAEAAP